MTRWLLAAALLWPAAAWADPITIVAALASTIGTSAAVAIANVAAFVAANAFAVGLVAVNVFGAVAGRRKARAAAARQRSEYNASLQDRSVTLLQANPPWRVVYGRAIVGGDIVAVFTTDKAGVRPNGASYTKPDALKHLVIVVAAHQVQAIHEVYIDGVALGALDGSGYVTGGEFFPTGTTQRTVDIAAGSTATVSPPVVALLGSYSTAGAGLDAVYTPQTVTLSAGNTVITNATGVAVTCNYTVASDAPRVRVQKHLGTDSQTADAYLLSVAPSQWTSTDRLRGLAYVVVTLDLEEPRFQGGPPALTIDVSGRLVYDPRSATTAYSTNPALIVRDFLTAPWGYGVAAADIDVAQCNAAANACDVAISLDVGGVVTTGQPTYTANGAFATDGSNKEAVLEDLCEAMAGFAAYGATWSIVAGAWTVPVMALTDDDLDGQIEIVQAGAGYDALINGVRGQLIVVGKASPSDFDPYQNSTFVTADGRELWADVTLPFTDNKARARNLARIMVERNRDGLVIRYPGKLRAWPLQIGDRVTVTSAEYGFSAKTFRVTDWQFGASTAVQLTLQEDAAAVYDLADAATADPAPNTGLPNPWRVAALTGVTATSSASTVLKSGGSALIPRILVQWAAVTDAYVADGSGRIEVLWQRPGGPWRLISEPGDATSTYIVGVDNGDPVTIEVRARNGLGAVSPSVFVGAVVNSSAALIRNDAIDSQAVATGNLVNHSVTSGTILDSSAVTGSSGSPGASVRVATVWGPTITTEAGDELDINVSGVLDDTYWSQAVLGSVELWLTHAPTFGGTQTEFGTRRKFPIPLDVYTATTSIALDMHGLIVPGAVTRDYVLRVSITYRDAAGAPKTCGKNFTANAQWRVVRRKR